MSTDSAPPRRSIAGILLRVVVVLAAAAAAIVGYGFTLPDDYLVERSTVIAAQPSAVFAQVNTLRNWDHWSPWAKLDPKAKNTFEGPESGEGAVFHWAGNNQVGEGKMTIIESKPDERVKLRLEFEKPMQDISESEFTFTPQDGGTRVTWNMTGRYQSVFQKLMCKMMDMDKMIGGYYEQGFTNLKQVVETKS